MRPVVVVDYGMGNLGSVVSAFNALGVACEASSEPKRLANASGIVLPGVGAFGAAMVNLRERGLDEALTEHVVSRKTPFLGICLGLQLIAQDSTEQGYAEGLGWIEGRVERIPVREHNPVPHVGWNEVELSNGSPLFAGIGNLAHFVFDHSYQLRCASEFVAATCNYGGNVVAAIQKDNICAVQFHPEKSQRHGLRMLRNFSRCLDQS
jgi:imidazole glycerol-phosphate synthase subunit HisH